MVRSARRKRARVGFAWQPSRADPTQLNPEQLASLPPFSIELSPKQAQALRDMGDPGIREHCEEGGARSGKTFAIIVSIIERAIQYPGSRHLIARYRYNHLVTTVWRQTLLPLLQMYFPDGEGFAEDKAYRTITLWNGSTFQGAGLDDSDRVEKLMGSEYSTIFLNEATQCSYATFQKIKSRLSQRVRKPETGKEILRKIIVDCNPRNRFHWIYKYFLLRIDPTSGEALTPAQTATMRNRKWLPTDNPHLPADYVEMLSNLSGVERQRLFEGQWVAQEGLVYPGFEATVVEPFPIPADWEITGAVDFGYTNPFAFLWFAFDRANETFYLFDEYYVREKTVAQHCAELKRRRRCAWIVADHDAEDRATMAAAGFVTSPADKAISVGIQAVTTLLQAEHGFRLRIFRSCVHTVEELSVYSWEEPREGRNAKEEPKKENDHAADALRYWAARIMGVRGVVTVSPAPQPVVRTRVSGRAVHERRKRNLTNRLRR